MMKNLPLYAGFALVALFFVCIVFGVTPSEIINTTKESPGVGLVYLGFFLILFLVWKKNI